MSLNSLKITCAEETNEFYILGTNSRGLIFIRENLNASYNLTSLDGLEMSMGDVKDNHDNLWVTNEKGFIILEPHQTLTLLKTLEILWLIF